jgi:hypothetical protein
VAEITKRRRTWGARVASKEKRPAANPRTLVFSVLEQEKADSSVKAAVAGYMVELALDGAGKPLAALAVLLAESLEVAPPYARGKLARELRELLVNLDEQVARENELAQRRAERRAQNERQRAWATDA